MENWRFVHAAAIAAIQSHTFGDPPIMQYFFKQKVYTIIHDQSQKIAPNIVVPSVQAVEVAGWPFFWHVMLHLATK